MRDLYPAVFTVLQFAHWACLSRTMTYELIKAGELHSFKVKGRRYIRVEDARAWLQAAAASGAPSPREVVEPLTSAHI